MKLSSVYDYADQKSSQESLLGLTITNAEGNLTPSIPLDFFLKKDVVIDPVSKVAEDFSHAAIYARTNNKYPPDPGSGSSSSSSTTHTTYTETNTNPNGTPSLTSPTSTPSPPSSNPPPGGNPITSGNTIPTPPPGTNVPSSPNDSPLSSSSPSSLLPSPSPSSPSTPSLSPQSSPPSTISLQSPTARPYLIAAIPVVFVALIITVGLFFLRRRRRANNTSRQSNAPYMGELAALSSPTDSNRGTLRSFFGRRERNSLAFLTAGAFPRNNRRDVANSDSGRTSDSVVQSEEGDGSSNSYISDGNRSDYRYDPSFTQFVC